MTNKMSSLDGITVVEQVLRIPKSCRQQTEGVRVSKGLNDSHLQLQKSHDSSVQC